MRSYGLGMAFTMLVAALYAFQNKGEIVVRFLTWERTLPQGVWEIALFALGCVVMWLVSLSAIMETRNRNSGIIKDQKARLSELEDDVSVLRDERNSLMIALRRTGGDMDISESVELREEEPKWDQDVTEYAEPSEEPVQEEISPDETDNKPEADITETLISENMEGEGDLSFYEEIEEEEKTDN